jgi:two-component system sensor histidine kinase YesM
VIVPVVAAGFYLIVSMANIIQENVVNEALSDAANLATQLRAVILNAAIASERVYGDRELTALFNDGFFDEDDEQRGYYGGVTIVQNYLKANPQLKSITFYLEDYDFKRGNEFKAATDEIKAAAWYQDAISSRGAIWRFIHVDPKEQAAELPSANNGAGDGEAESEDEPAPALHRGYLSYVRALRDAQGRDAGVMVISVNPEWLDTIMSEEAFNVVFTVGGGSVFYSNIEDISAGSAIYVAGDMFRPGAFGTEDISDGEYRLTRRGFTVVSYFDYENTGNLFQVYLVKPYSIIAGHTGRVMVSYFFYMLLCAALSFLLTALFSSFFSRRIKFLKDEMHAVAKGNFALEKGIRGTDEIFDLYSDLKHMVDSMQGLINEAYAARLQAESFKLNQIEAEFKTLASQINPHFLYNTLETIRMKAYTGGDRETAGLVKQLGKFMRRCLEVKDGLVTLESELEFTSGYLEIQKARFGERVTYSLYCEVDRNYKILPLIIQPIVENAFVHGVEKIKGGGQVRIKVYYKNDRVIIDVSDNGQGMNEAQLSILLNKLNVNDTSSGKSIGLTNVNKRIKIYHGETYGLTVTGAQGKGTRVRVTLPREVEERSFLSKQP